MSVLAHPSVKDSVKYDGQFRVSIGLARAKSLTYLNILPLDIRSIEQFMSRVDSKIVSLP
jgi:hypothetical protein